jgi:hypothetical protein
MAAVIEPFRTHRHNASGAPSDLRTLEHDGKPKLGHCREKAACARALLHACDDFLALRIPRCTNNINDFGASSRQVREFCPIRIDDFDGTLNGNNVGAIRRERMPDCAQDGLSRRNSQNSKQIQQLLGCLRAQDSRDLGRYRTYKRWSRLKRN